MYLCVSFVYKEVWLCLCVFFREGFPYIFSQSALVLCLCLTVFVFIALFFYCVRERVWVHVCRAESSYVWSHLLSNTSFRLHALWYNWSFQKRMRGGETGDGSLTHQLPVKRQQKTHNAEIRGDTGAQPGAPRVSDQQRALHLCRLAKTSWVLMMWFHSGRENIPNDLKYSTYTSV